MPIEDQPGLLTIAFASTCAAFVADANLLLVFYHSVWSRVSSSSGLWCKRRDPIDYAGS